MRFILCLIHYHKNPLHFLRSAQLYNHQNLKLGEMFILMGGYWGVQGVLFAVG